MLSLSRTRETQFGVPPFRILLIEDNPADARLLQHYICTSASGRGYNVRHVCRLAEGLDQIRSTRFDLVILDLDLLDSSGVDSVRIVRANMLEVTPLLVYSGTMDDELRQDTLACGASQYLCKMNSNMFSLRAAITDILEPAAGRTTSESRLGGRFSALMSHVRRELQTAYDGVKTESSELP